MEGNMAKEKIISLGEDYMPKSISYLDGFLGPRGDVGYLMKFSIKKAKEIMKRYKMNEIINIKAGLDGDFKHNHDTIFENGNWKEKYNFYKRSCWAKPIIIIFFKDGPSETFECWEK